MLIGGILCHDSLPPKPILWLTIIAILCCAACISIRRGKLSSAILAACVFFVGLTGAQLEAFFFPHNHIAIYTGQDQKLAELELRLIEPPHLTGGEAELRRLPLKQSMKADVVAIHLPSGW